MTGSIHESASSVPTTERTPDSIVARLTPSGRGAVSIVGISGPQAGAILAACWSLTSGEPSKALFREWTPDEGARPLFGLFHFDEERGSADECVLYRRSPSIFEIDCHGGELVTSRIIERCVALGAREVSDSEWKRETLAIERRALYGAEKAPFSEQVYSLFFDAAYELISETTTEETAKIACDQEESWKMWFDSFVGDCQRVRNGLGDDKERFISSVRAKINSVLKTERIGRLLTTPCLVAIFGAPNVGKSSLLNALLGYDRAIVSPFAGTTRDLLEENLAYKGWLFRFVDCAGLRETDDSVESEGIKLATKLAHRADIAVRVYDPLVDREEQERAFCEFLSPDAPFSARDAVVDVLNKTDVSQDMWHESWREALEGRFLRLSAIRNDGVETLLSAIYSRVVLEMGVDVDTSRRIGPWIWREEQFSFLSRLDALCSSGDFNECLKMVCG
ncbi:MAG: GTPase [Thermoguttaceae bacterium]